MTFHYSLPFEKLIEDAPGTPASTLTQARVVIIGSGYGGCVAALQLANPAFQPTSGRHDVIVLERGQEYALGDFPNDLEDLPLHVQMRSSDGEGNGKEDALFDIRMGEGVDALVGSGLGGTSLINANVAIRPDLDALRESPWPRTFRERTVRDEMEHALGKVEHWLGASADPKLTTYEKHAAFARYAAALGIEARPAPVAVTFADRDNAAGIRQPACTGCGNCVTGCNVGSKNTLAMNVIPAAAKYGAEFYTGALVHAIEPVSHATKPDVRWRIHVRPTSPLTRARVVGPLFIEADVVILAAGTLGSTEILKRSEALGFVTCSTRLGQQFSTNGDGLAMSFGERDRVNAVGERDYLQPASAPGPTITAMAVRRKTLFGDRYLLEEGSIPSPLIEILGEVITTAAQIGRLGWNKLPAWFSNRTVDPVAVQRGALDHSQVFLVMSDDDAVGSLQFRGDPRKSPGAGGIVPHWPDEGESPNPVLARIDTALARHDREAGLNGGQYVHNPLWQTLPASSSGLQGKFPGGRLLTVHPLGGCCMGDDFDGGVVDQDGAVFKGPGTATWPGLYVLDGSIVPGPLGHNPFLTIAALAWRASAKIPGATEKNDIAAKPPLRMPGQPTPRAAGEEIIVREQLVGQAKASDAHRQLITTAIAGSARWFGYDGLILRVETDPTSTDVALSGSGLAKVHLKLFWNPDGATEAERWHTYGVTASRLTHAHLIAQGTGTLSLMAADSPQGDQDLMSRRDLALDAYKARREHPFWLSIVRHFGLVGDKPPSHVPLYRQARGFLAAAEMQCTYRRFDYRLQLTAGRHDIEITGTKVIAWRKDVTALWDAMSHVDLTLKFPQLNAEATCAAYVDMDYVTGDGLLTVASDDNTTRATFNCIAYAARLGRSIAQSSFWEFGAPKYPRSRMVQHPGLPTRIGSHLRNGPFALPVSARRSNLRNAQPITLHLHRYGVGGARGPALLIHGLAQGSLIFAHEDLPVSMARYLLDQGYDVWLLDYRLSNRFDAQAIAYDGWSIDEIGDFDIPAAVQRVFQDSGRRKLHVFAHCVGAVGISMAILKGRITSDQIASVALNAIHPWIMPSPFNQVRAKLGVAFRDYIGNDGLDPIIQARDEVNATQSLLDRIGFSIARIGEPRATHTLDDDDLCNAICDRMTFLYGRMWEHANVADVHPYWQDLVGRAPGAVYRHLHHMLVSERIVDREGDDVYLTSLNIPRWRGIRTLFMHGEKSLVFNPQSATRSAIWLRDHLTPPPGGASTPVRLRRIPGFGHMDVILADGAAGASFCYLDHFFRGDFDSSDSFQVPNGPLLTLNSVLPKDDPELKLGPQPLAGPVIRAARVDGNELVVRHWIELPADAAWMNPVQFLDPAPNSSQPVVPANLNSSYKWVDARYEQSKWSHFPRSWIDRLPGVGSTTKDCHFIVASCWYPGMPMDRGRSDQTFAGIEQVLARNEPCDALFLIGDQIYADANGGILDPVTWRDRYTNRYREAFSGLRASSLLRRIPTHFAIDDHEVANDFAGPFDSTGSGLMPSTERTERLRQGDIDRYQLDFARNAARSYVGAARDAKAFGSSFARGGELWYELDSQELAVPTIILDTRSKRQRAHANRGPALMLGQEPNGTTRQLDDLKQWLTNLAGDPRPKFIFSGSVIAPVEISHGQSSLWLREDGYAGYPEELAAIIGHIIVQNVQRVVFVSGDMHLSATAQLQLFDSAGVQRVAALQIVSSALYAPLPFVNTAVADIDWVNPPRVQAGQFSIGYAPRLLTNAPAHFVKVAAAPDGGAWRISATAYGPSGAPIGAAHSYTL